MSRRSIQILFAIVIGVLVTAVTAFAASVLSSESAREILFWPNTLLQSLAPAPKIGTPDHPVYEGTPLNSVAFLVSFPFAVIFYGAVAYVFLRRLKT
jgi:uncharacterized membrane protein YagU involved in acid resistance